MPFFLEGHTVCYQSGTNVMSDWQTLVGEVHRRVLVEYVRAIMRGRVICTSSKMRKRMAFRLQDEAKQLKGLFKDLVSLVLTQNITFI